MAKNFTTEATEAHGEKTQKIIPLIFLRVVRGEILCVFFIASIPLANLVAAEVKLTDATIVRFADVPEGIQAVTRRDDYIRALGPFDRQVRLKTDRPVSEDELLAFVGQNVRPWSDAEIARLAQLVGQLAARLAPWKLKLPPLVLLVKTTGREEGGAAYCRGAAIVLPQNLIDGRLTNLGKLLTHELFHVLSSHNPDLRTSLYAVIGFRPCNEVQLPEPLAARKITNPDAPLNNYFITAEWRSRPAEWMSVLVSKYERYDPARGGSLFSYLDFKLLLLANDNGTRRAAIENGMPVLVEPAEVPGFGEQIGGNTKYIIHPEEILADNFVLLVEGRIDPPTPRILKEMGRLLQEAAK
jgi:hypothetical protein